MECVMGKQDPARSGVVKWRGEKRLPSNELAACKDYGQQTREDEKTSKIGGGKFTMWYSHRFQARKEMVTVDG